MLLLFAALLPATMHAQPHFKNKYDWGNQERAYAHRPTADGGHITAGTIFIPQPPPNNPGYYAIQLTKTMANGDVQWQRYYLPSATNKKPDEAAALAVREWTSGTGTVLGYVVTGYVYEDQNGRGKDIFFLQTDANGNSDAFDVYDAGEHGDDVGHDIIITTNGVTSGTRFLIVGGVNAAPGSYTSQYSGTIFTLTHRGDMVAMRLRPLGGTPDWVKIINEPAPPPQEGLVVHQYTWGHSVAETDDAFYVVGAHHDPALVDPFIFPFIREHLYLAKLDKASGTILWTRIFPDPQGNGDRGYGIRVNVKDPMDPMDDELMIVGSTLRTNLDIYALVLDINGNVLRSKVYYADGDDVPLYLTRVDANGDGTDDGYLFSGYTTSFNSTGNKDMFAYHVSDYLGSGLGISKFIQGDRDEVGYSVAQDNSNYISVAGTSDSYSAGANDDIYLARTDKTQRCEESCRHFSVVNVTPEPEFRPWWEVVEISLDHVDRNSITNVLPTTAFCGSCSDYNPAYCNDPNAYTFHKEGHLNGHFMHSGSALLQLHDDHYAHASYDVKPTTSVGVDPNGYTSEGDLWLMKTDYTDGTNIWHKHYYSHVIPSITGTVQDVTVRDMVEGRDYSITMTGSHEVKIPGPPAKYDTALYIFRVTSSGALSGGFSKAYGKFDLNNPSYDYGMSIRQVAYDDGFIVAGYSNSTFNASTPDDYNVMAVRTNSGGNFTSSSHWSYLYGGDYEDRGMAVRICHNSSGDEDGFIIVGYSNSFADMSDGTRDFDVYLLRLNTDGTLRWSRTYGTEGHDLGIDIVETADRGYLITGLTDVDADLGTVDNSMLIMKVDPNGDLEWTRSISATDDDQGRSIVETTDGGFAVAGCTITPTYGKQMLLVKLGECLDIQWSRAFPTPSGSDPFTADLDGDDWAEKLVQTSDGGYLVHGVSTSYYDRDFSGNPLTITPGPGLPANMYHYQDHLVRLACDGDVCLSEEPIVLFFCNVFATVEPETEALDILDDLEVLDVEVMEENIDRGYRICPEDDRPGGSTPPDGEGAISGLEGSGRIMEGEAYLSVHPTPIVAGETLEIGITSGVHSDWSLTVTDMAGTVVHTAERPTEGILHISTRGWTAGTYLVTARQGEITLEVQKVVVTK